ncbi:MAG: cation diffusion facilitator family transporter [Candidatus Micrarchaeota archaeon]
MEEGSKELGNAFLITLAVLVVQLFGWYWSNSLALLSDSGHVFSDLLAVGASFLALRLASCAPSSRRTFGLHRFEIFAALFNGVLLVVMAILIAYEAFQRLDGGYVVSGLPMLTTAAVGLFGNLYVAYRLQHEENLNVRSAFMHAAGDALSSVGVILGAVIIVLTRVYVVDVVISFLISCVILFSAYNVLRSSLSILLESAPYGVGTENIAKAILSIKGIRSVHDIHVWRTCSEFIFVMMHAEVDDMRLGKTRLLREKIEHKLRKQFSVSHTTIQFEPHGCTCENKKACRLLKHGKAGHKH